MEYESTILKRLIDTYGVVGNPRYISEIIKEFIVRGKECFPNLFTYQADWLAHIDEFGLKPTYTVSYTGQSIYAPNTLERPVKNAILKGSTKYRDIDTGEFLETFEEGRNLELVSVKMPVLCTTGKNLFDGKFEFGEIAGGANDKQTKYVKSTSYISIKPNTNYFLSCTDGYNSTGGRVIAWYDSNRNFISHVNNKGVSPSNAYFARIRTRRDDSAAMTGNEISTIQAQFEESSSATSYEPHKTNILSTPEDLELRGIGNVKDELNLLTGEISNNFNKITIDGTENWYKTSNETELTVRYRCDNIGVSILKENICICDSYNVGGNTVGDILAVAFGGTTLTYRVLKSKFPTVEDFKKWLNDNPHTFIYQTEKSIKTVDLTILDQNGQNVKQLMSFNGGTHFTTSSQEGSLIPSLTVDVVTNLEETLKVCSLEGNTM